MYTRPHPTPRRKAAPLLLALVALGSSGGTQGREPVSEPEPTLADNLGVPWGFLVAPGSASSTLGQVAPAENPTLEGASSEEQRTTAFGCQEGSAELRLAAGRPGIGQGLLFELSGAAPTPRAPLGVLVLSGSVLDGFPCGRPVRTGGGWGELLFPAHVRPLSVATGSPYVGGRSYVRVNLPWVPELVGRDLFAQGFLIDPGHGSLVATTRGVRFRLER